MSRRGPSSSSRGQRAASPSEMIGRLRVMVEADQAPPGYEYAQTKLPDTSVEFRAAATVVNLALSMLETPEGRSCITRIGQTFIASRRSFHHIYEDDPRNMPWWVDFFLNRLRATFPNVVLSNHINGEGQTEKSNWARGGLKMRQWDPSMAGTMRLNKKVIENMITAGNNSASTNHPDELTAFESFMFLVSVTIAHELMHLFIGFLAGYNWPSTPPQLSFLPELFNNEIDDQEVGESGRYWEGVVLGGTVETYEDTSNPLGSRQAGDLFLFDSQMRARKLDRGCIRRNLDFNFDFPLRTVGRSIHIDDLDDQRRPMKDARATSLPRGVSLDRDRARTVEPAQLEYYASLPSHTATSIQMKGFDAAFDQHGVRGIRILFGDDTQSHWAWEPSSSVEQDLPACFALFPNGDPSKLRRIIVKHRVHSKDVLKIEYVNMASIDKSQSELGYRRAGGRYSTEYDTNRIYVQSFLIDGPGGERIESFSTLWTHALVGFEIKTNRGRTAAFTGGTVVGFWATMETDPGFTAMGPVLR
ncbi:hypothetical protein FOXYS1_7877 [Fusarium oxysporum]|uniref:DUF7600 domain-containing protein n=1 Tax=Fusarium oxysporum TaxID=5507 RepID=A0A8H5EI18_FUSOX|nr:hypothetical protein FOXYS1_7877 [Fusarium oxysporum]